MTPIPRPIPDAELPPAGSFADKRQTFLIMFWARFYFMCSDELGFPDWYRSWPLGRDFSFWPDSRQPRRDYYGYGLDRLVRAFDTGYRWNEGAKRFTRDEKTWWRFFNALDRAVTAECRKRHLMPTAARAKAKAKRNLAPYVERGDWEHHMRAIHFGRCGIHDRSCGNHQVYHVGEINGQICCYRFRVDDLVREIAAGATQLSMFGEVA